MRAGIAVLVAVAALVAGCSGGSAEPPPAAATSPAPPGGVPDASAGQALLAFVRAARDRDAAALWAALSRETRASAGGTEARFRADLAAQLADHLEHFEVQRVVLSHRLGERAVVALAGLRPPTEDDEPEEYAWAAVLVREGADWRVDLGGVAIERLEPSPLEETDERPELGARAAAAGRVDRIALWLDGRPVRGGVRRELPFVAEIEATPRNALARGVHHAVAYAEGGGTAGAIAWPFTVK